MGPPRRQRALRGACHGLARRLRGRLLAGPWLEGPIASLGVGGSLPAPLILYLAGGIHADSGQCALASTSVRRPTTWRSITPGSAGRVRSARDWSLCL